MAFQFGVFRQVGFFERCFSDTYSLALEIQRIASINFLGKREVRAVGSIRNPFLGFQTSNWICQNSEPEYQNYDSFRFSTFWFLFVNQSRVNLVFS
ncbi:hypothetical protein ACNPDC_004451, partial [Vibrio vulnificus]